MIKFSDFMPVDFPDKTKVKFNMNAGEYCFACMGLSVG